MTKSEQIRLTHWRFKVLQQAADVRYVARVLVRWRYECSINEPGWRL